MKTIKEDIQRRLDILYEEAIALEKEIHWINHEIEDLENQLEDAEE